MLFITNDGTIDFEDLGYLIKTISYDQLPRVRQTSESVIGKDGNVKFTDGFNDKIIKITLTAKDNISLGLRRINARSINQEIYKPGQLVLNYEPIQIYDAQVVTRMNARFNSTFDELSLIFNATSISYNRYDSDLEWAEADIPWILADLYWAGIDSSFIITPSSEIDVINDGNYIAKSIITLNGTGTITVNNITNGESFIITSLSGIINIDTKALIVYDDSDVSQISKFSGDYMNLEIGTNELTFSGSFTSITLSFEKQSAYL